MPDLSFEVIGAEVPAFAAVPTLSFKLRIANNVEQERIYSISLRSQIRLAVTQRRYNAQEQAQLLEVFGEPGRWGETLRSLLWTHANMVVQQFTGSTVVDLPVPCTYDFEVVSTKYFHALEGGEIPLLFLFSGTIFYEGKEGQLQIGQISWSKEASFRLPVARWQEMMARYYPNSTWIRLQKDVFDQLYQYKSRHGLPTWEETLLRLLRASDEEVSP
jgi:hypothetical protein